MKLIIFITVLMGVIICAIKGPDLLHAEDAMETRAEKRASIRDLDYARVVFVKAVYEGGRWRFDVTVRHNDEGWDHYADLWQIMDPETGSVIARRILAHPHEAEQPFTRSLGSIEIPDTIETVLVRARCNVHGFGPRTVMVDLGQPEGESFEVVGGTR